MTSLWKTKMRPMMTKTTAPTRRLSSIARDIRNDWKNVNYAAKPYLSAMEFLGTIKSYYFCDQGTEIVAYFLSNAQTWRGATARRIKAELNAMLEAERGS
jgi:hypothetical protein